jgi:hypothetical protein
VSVTTLASWLISEINGLISAAIEAVPKTYHAAIVPGSWNPVTGTVTVRQAHTAANPNDGVSQVQDIPNIPLKTGGLGQQYGPRGWELVTVTPRVGQSGGVAHLEHDPVTSPGAPSGEHWLCHYTASGSIDAFVKLTNTTGIDILAANKFHVYTTGGIVAIDADDATGLTQIGATGLVVGDAVALQSMIQAQIVAYHNNHTHSGVQTGSGVSGPPVSPMPNFQGSQTVRANS